jgi:putative transposase
VLGFFDQEDPMKGKRFKEEQIIRILQEAEAGVAVADLCRKHNCSEQSFYRWKSKYAWQAQDFWSSHPVSDFGC